MLLTEYCLETCGRLSLLGQSPLGMAMCTVWQSVLYWGMVESGPSFVRRRTVDSEGGGGGVGQFLKNISWP